MKKTVLILLLAIQGVSWAASQWDSSDYLPIVREGVKWINEKVIINHGDTTSYYYIYEFSGYDSVCTNMPGEINNACYYYTDGELDVERDSLIAGFRDCNPWRGEVTFVRNDAYWSLWLEDMINIELDLGKEFRLMFQLAGYLDGGTTRIYYFSNCVRDYLRTQEFFNDSYGYEIVLTPENFTEVEPLEIEGHSCSRYAYVKENGDTMCYVVEGIGFDSRDMGDLLTPFTREPDPDADYQEYCGLCHVVKDGQIIYKGMRYTPDNMTGINEVVSDQRPRQYDDNYYNLMGQPVGKALPATPGIYIHHGKKIVIR